VPAIIFVATFLLPTTVRAQTETATVTGHGTVELERPPESLRVQVDVLAKGKDVKEALARLKERRESAQGHLERSGASAASFTVSRAVIGDEKSERQKQLEMMMGGRVMNQPKAPAAKKKQAPSILVSAILTAEIPLKASSPEELMILSHDLEEKLKAADLGGLKELKQLSPQDEESAEETPQMMAMNVFGMAGESKRGEPSFSYVSKLSEEAQAKATAQAFQSAKQDAARLARAAGSELGSVHRIEDTSPLAGAAEDSSPAGAISSFYRSMLQGEATGAKSTPHAGEAVGSQPGKVIYRVSISATFSLKK